MTAVTLPKYLEAWAEAEVAAGRAESVEALAVRAVAGYRRQMEAFRSTLDAVAAKAKYDEVILGGIPVDRPDVENRDDW